MLSYLNGEILDLDVYFQAYVDQVVANVMELYSGGKARRMIVSLVGEAALTKTPLYKKLECPAGNGDLPLQDILDSYVNYQNLLKTELENFALLPQINNFDLTIVYIDSALCELYDNPQTYGIASNVDTTMLDLGWPDKTFENQFWFDDYNLSSHTNRVLANLVKTWFKYC